MTSATDDSGFQGIAYSDGAGNVLHLTRDASGFQALSATESLVPSASTRFPVAAAYGEERMMVAWIDDATFTDRHSNVRWAIRDVAPAGGIVWTFGDLAVQTGLTSAIVQKEIGLGFDPGNGVFALTAIQSRDVELDPDFPDPLDGDPLFAVIDPVTAEVVNSSLTVSSFDTSLVLRSIGKPVCHLVDPELFTGASSHCAVPIVAALPIGPELHMLYVTLDLQFGPTILGVSGTVQPLGLASHGLVDLAGDIRDRTDIGFLGAWTAAAPAPADTPAAFVTFRTRAVNPGTPPATGPIGVEPVTLADIDLAPGVLGDAVLPAWPAAIGTQWFDGSVRFSAWRIDPSQEVEIPDTEGVPTSGPCPEEEPDSSDVSSSDSSSASETGGGDPTGCDCDTSPTGTSLSIWSLPLLLGRRRGKRTGQLASRA